MHGRKHDQPKPDMNDAAVRSIFVNATAEVGADPAFVLCLPADRRLRLPGEWEAPLAKLAASLRRCRRRILRRTHTLPGGRSRRSTMLAGPWT